MLMQRCLQVCKPLLCARLRILIRPQIDLIPSRHQITSRAYTSHPERQHKPLSGAYSRKIVLDSNEPSSKNAVSENAAIKSSKASEEIPTSRSDRSSLKREFKKKADVLWLAGERPGGINKADLKELDLAPNAKSWIDLFIHKSILQRQWMHSLFHILVHDRSNALDFILKTHGVLVVPSPFIGLALGLLARDFSRLNQEDAVHSCRQLFQAMEKLSQRYEGEPLKNVEACIRLIFPYITTEDKFTIYSLGIAGRISVTPPAYQLLISNFAKLDMLPEAIGEFCRNIPSSQYPRTEAFAILLHHLESSGDVSRNIEQLVQGIKQSGYQPQTQEANVILRMALKHTAYHLSTTVYSTLFSHKTPPNKATIALLIGRDWASDTSALPFGTIVDEAIKYGLNKSSEVCRWLLFRFFRRVMQDSPGTAWNELVALHDELYRPDDLIALGLPLYDTRHARSVDDSRKESRPANVTTMLNAYLKLHALGQLQTSDPVDVYKAFHSMVKQGVPAFLQLAQEPIIYNMFMTLFVQKAETLINATEIMKDLQTPLPAEIGTKCQPDVQSWNIFLLGFQIHGKPVLAEQVLKYMRANGIEPNEVTWGQLVQDYADDQDLDGLLDALKRAGTAGVDWSDNLGKSIDRFEDQELLTEALEKHGFTGNLDFSDDLKSGLQARISQGRSAPKE